MTGGLLASDPAALDECGDIHEVKIPTLRRASYSMTNRGLQIEVIANFSPYLPTD
jgi:hypothetical protein